VVASIIALRGAKSMDSVSPIYRVEYRRFILCCSIVNASPAGVSPNISILKFHNVSW
jgi:hypothetical protein